MDIKIRKGSDKDLPKVLEMVKDLAVFEKEPEAVTAKLEDYYEAMKSGLISFFVAESNSKIVGMSLFYDTFSTWKGKMLYMEDFIVDENMRGHGIGKALFDATVQEAKDTGCKLIKWQVLDWNEGAVRFYEREGAVIEKEWWNGKIIF